MFSAWCPYYRCLSLEWYLFGPLLAPKNSLVQLVENEVCFTIDQASPKDRGACEVSVAEAAVVADAQERRCTAAVLEITKVLSLAGIRRFTAHVRIVASELISHCISSPLRGK